MRSKNIWETRYPFELRQITFYSNPASDVKRYKDFEIPKKSGGTRKISAPVEGLKIILKCMNMILQEIYEPSKYAMGFTKNRSVVDNAKRHINQNYVFNIDLKDFFPSITRARICARLKVKPFELSDDIARMISGLCTMKVTDGENIKYVLPQGAPTSPTLTNIICDKLDHKLAGLAKRFGLNYSLDMLMILHLVVAIMFIKKKAILGKNFNVLSRRMDLSSTIRKLDCKNEVAGKKSQV